MHIRVNVINLGKYNLHCTGKYILFNFFQIIC